MTAPPSSQGPYRARSLAPLALAIVASGTPVVAQPGLPAAPSPAASDTLFVNAELTHIASGPQGGTAAVDWLHVLSSGNAVNVGLLSFSLGDTKWTYGRAGTMVRLSRRTAVHGQVDAGEGREQQSTFMYFAAQATFDHELVEKRLALEFQDRYVNIHTTSGSIVKVGLTWLPVKPLSLAAAFHSSFGGGLSADAVSIRIDGHHGGWALFAGVSTGRSRPALVGLGAGGSAQSLDELFAGTTIPINRLRITLALDSLHLGLTRRRSFSASWFVPL